MRNLLQQMPTRVKISSAWLSVLALGSIVSYIKFTDFGEGILGFVPLHDPDRSCNLGLPGCTTGAGPDQLPSFTHLLGTDDISRDIFSRILAGAQVSLSVALAAVFFGVVFGSLLGSIAGFFGGRIESGIMSTIDIVLAFPGLVLLLAVIAVFEDRGLLTIALTIGVLAIAPYTRIARGTALTIKRREFVQAAEAIGTHKLAILRGDIIPNVLPTVFAFALVSAAVVIVLEGSLAFLGLSVVSRASWGQMIFQSQKNLKVTIWPAVWPSLALIFTVLSLNQVGDWLRSRSDVRTSAL